MNNPALENLWKTPFHIDFSVDTMEEHLALVEAPVSSQSRDKLVAIDRPADGDAGPATDLIGHRQVPSGTGTIDTVLVHFRSDSDSPSGWSQVDYKVPAFHFEGVALSGIRAMTGFHQHGITYLFVHYQSPAAGQENVDLLQVLCATWSQGRPKWTELRESQHGSDALTLLAKVRQFSIHRCADGTHVAYGISQGYGNEQFFMVTPETPESDGTARASEVGFTALRDAAFAAPNWSENADRRVYQLADDLVSGASDDARCFKLLRMTDNEIELHKAFIRSPDEGHEDPWLDFSKESQLIDTTGMDLSDARIQAIPAGPTHALLVHQADGRVAMIENYLDDAPKFTSLMTGDAPKKAARLAVGTVGPVGVPTSELALYVSDADKTLWVRRIGAEGPSSSDWVLLGDKVEELACPRVTLGAGEVFLTGTLNASTDDVAITYKTANAKTTSWMSETLAVSTANRAIEDKDILPIRAHVFDILVKDANGIAVPDRDVTLTCEAPALLYIDGRTYRVGPRLPLHLKTDKVTGRIRAIMRASGLVAPEMQVRISNMDDATPVKILPNARITERLAGNAEGGRYDVAAAISKQIPDDFPEAHRKHVLQLVKNYGDTASKAKRGAKSDGEVRAVYVLSTDGNGQFSDVTNDRAFLEIANDPGIGGLTVNGLAGDIINLIGSGFEKIRQVLVTIYEAGVEFVVTIGKQTMSFASSVFENIVDSFVALGRFLEKVFQAMGRAVKDLVETILNAVTFILDGPGIFAASDAMQAGIKATVRTIANAAATGAQTMNETYKQHIDKLDEWIDFATGQAKETQDEVKKFETRGFLIDGKKVEAPAALVRSNRAGSDVMSSALSHLAQKPPTGMALPEDELSPLRDLILKIKDYYEKDINGPLEKLVKEDLKNRDLVEIIAKDPFELLALFRGIIKTLAKVVGDVFETMIKLLGMLANRIISMLDAQIDIGILTTLVRLWSKDNTRKLTFFDALTLPVAFIGTAIWKCVSGKDLVTPADTVTLINWIDERDGVIFDLWGSSKPLDTAPAACSSGAADAALPLEKDAMTKIRVVSGIFAGLKIIVGLAKIALLPALIGIRAIASLGALWEATQVPKAARVGVGLLSFVTSALPTFLMIATTMIRLGYELAKKRSFPEGKEFDSLYNKWAVAQFIGMTIFATIFAFVVISKSIMVFTDLSSFPVLSNALALFGYVYEIYVAFGEFLVYMGLAILAAILLRFNAGNIHLGLDVGFFSVWSLCGFTELCAVPFFLAGYLFSHVPEAATQTLAVLLVGGGGVLTAISSVSSAGALIGREAAVYSRYK